MKNVFTAGMLLAIGSLVLNAQPKPPAPDELKALQAIVNANTVDARVAAVDTFCEELPQKRIPEFRADHGRRSL